MALFATYPHRKTATGVASLAAAHTDDRVTGEPAPATLLDARPAPLRRRPTLAQWFKRWLRQPDARLDHRPHAAPCTPDAPTPGAGPSVLPVTGRRFEQIQVGDILSGHVVSLTDYGVFVDLKPVVGMVHISDLSWRRCKHPSELAALGDRVQVKVLRIDPVKRRISLGMKQLVQDPWVNLARHYPVGMTLPGHVSSLTDYGAFVEISPEISGLVHKSEISWAAACTAPETCLCMGQAVQVAVLEVDEGGHRLSLSIKRATPSPWPAFVAQVPCGSRVQATVERVGPQGFEIRLPGNLTAWAPCPHGYGIMEETYQPGDPVEAVVTHFDPATAQATFAIMPAAA